MFCLFGAAAGFYYLQPNLDEIKQNISGLVSQPKSVETVDRLESMPNEISRETKIEIQKKIKPVESMPKIKSSDLNMVVAKVDNIPKEKEVESIANEAKPKSTDTNKPIKKINDIKFPEKMKPEVAEKTPVSTVVKLKHPPIKKIEKAMVAPKETPALK